MWQFSHMKKLAADCGIRVAGQFGIGQRGLAPSAEPRAQEQHAIRGYPPLSLC